MPAHDNFSRNRQRLRHIDDEVRHQIAQLEAEVEPESEGGGGGCILAVIQRLGGTGQRGLEVTGDGVDPLELGQISRLERSHDIRHVDTARLDDCRKAAQAITGDGRGGPQSFP